MNEARPEPDRQPLIHTPARIEPSAAPPSLTLVHERRISILRCHQWVPVRRPDVFEFFSNARNLESITPPFLNFRIRYVSSARVRKGTRLDYRLTLHGWPVRWSTLIEAFEPPCRFVDVQTRGPFRLWRHMHRFTDCDGGTRLEDEVTYRLYGQWFRSTPLLGWVHRDVRAIFEYRRQAIARRFA